jgi:phospholipid/cholesterol/gamma-HCH transport system permease protein
LATAEKSGFGCGFPLVAAASGVCCPDFDIPALGADYDIDRKRQSDDLSVELTVGSYAQTPPSGESITLTVGGDWSIRQGLPSLKKLQQSLLQSPVRQMRLDAGDLRKWDSSLPSFVLAVSALCRERNITLDGTALPAGVRRLIELATATPPRTIERKKTLPFVARIGTSTIAEARALLTAVAFLGESLIALTRLLRGRARYRPADLLLTMQECGAQALPIVSVISLLVGMIFAFVGAIQLRQFGADIYDANLVAVAMAREMAAVMTAIVLAGRTGAAFAAQIGAMQGNEEIDALSTFGISPVEFLVLPRMLALILMTPLLCIYANVMGIFGGFIVGINTLNVTPTAYLLQTQSAVTLSDFTIGVVKGSIFGALIAVTGCLRGIEAGRSAAAVGAAATSAVVSGILAIIVTDAICAVLLNILGL